MEVLSRIDIADVEHAQTLCMAYRSHYNAIRPHQALGGQIPNQKLAVGKPQQASGPIEYEKASSVDGLITEFSLAAKLFMTHLQELMFEYVEYYNQNRSHQSLDLDTPLKKFENPRNHRVPKYEERKLVRGLVTEFSQAA